MKQFLESSYYIDWHETEIKKLANTLALKSSTEDDLARNCFQWVRDNIKHSAEYRLNPVTCKASDVLKYRTGYCFAKSHLLAAILRANKLPAGLCYQRLSVNDDGAPYSLHGLNAVFLKNHGWYRIDARGNNDVVNAQFSPPKEQLAYPVNLQAEADLPEIWSEPLTIVISTLEKYQTYQDVYENLPDIELIKSL